MHSSLQNIRLANIPVPVSDLDGVDYPKPYRGKHKFWWSPRTNVICRPITENCSRPVTIRLKRCCRCIISMLQVSNSKWRPFPVWWPSLNAWAMPHKDEKVMPFFEQHKSLFRNPKKLADVVASLNADSEYAAILFLVVMAHLLVYQKARTWLLLYSGQSKWPFCYLPLPRPGGFSGASPRR